MSGIDGRSCSIVVGDAMTLYREKDYAGAAELLAQHIEERGEGDAGHDTRGCYEATVCLMLMSVEEAYGPEVHREFCRKFLSSEAVWDGVEDADEGIDEQDEEATPSGSIELGDDDTDDNNDNDS